MLSFIHYHCVTYLSKGLNYNYQCIWLQLDKNKIFFYTVVDHRYFREIECISLVLKIMPLSRVRSSSFTPVSGGRRMTGASPGQEFWAKEIHSLYFFVYDPCLRSTQFNISSCVLPFRCQVIIPYTHNLFYM